MTLPSWLEPASCLINWQHDRSAAVLLPGQRTFIFLYQENLIIGILLCLSQSKERAKTKLLSLYILHVHTGYEKATRWKWKSNQDSKMSSSMSGSNLAQSVAERLADQIQVFYQHAFLSSWSGIPVLFDCLVHPPLSSDIQCILIHPSFLLNLDDLLACVCYSHIICSLHVM